MLWYHNRFQVDQKKILLVEEVLKYVAKNVTLSGKAKGSIAERDCEMLDLYSASLESIANTPGVPAQ